MVTHTFIKSFCAQNIGKTAYGLIRSDDSFEVYGRHSYSNEYRGLLRAFVIALNTANWLFKIEITTDSDQLLKEWELLKKGQMKYAYDVKTSNQDLWHDVFMKVHARYDQVEMKLVFNGQSPELEKLSQMCVKLCRES